MSEQALEKAAAKTPAVIQTPDEYRSALLRWQEQNLNILTPFSNISTVAAGHGIITSLVQINTDTTKGGAEEVYDGLPFLKQGEVAIAKKGLRKLAEGLGVSVRLEHLSVGKIRHYWVVKAIASYRGIDGSTIEREACMEWDLQDGSDRLNGWTPAQKGEARKHGLRACETRAINAAIRECGCGIKQKYTKAELQKAFVAVRVMFQPDMSDPEVRRIVTERSLGSTNALYPSSAALPPASHVGAFDDEEEAPRTVGRGATESAKGEQPKGHEPATSGDTPPVEGAVRITKVDAQTGEKNGRKWTRFVVTDSTSASCSTFDTKVADAASKFLQERAWVELITEKNGEFTNLIAIEPAGQNPSLPLQSEL